ncbi:MAG: acyl-CoA dehydrogenase family protein [Rubripirellula sp.]
MPDFPLIETPQDPALDQLCNQLKEWAPRWKRTEDWPAEALQACGKAGVYRWFVAEDQGGLGWTSHQQTQGYLKLAAADLTTTFVITQYMGAIRRIATSKNQTPADQWLGRLAAGEAYSTVGISHLTTSGRHLKKPVLIARENERGYVLNGMSPWVTGGPHADVMVIGASLEDGRQILAAVPGSLSGIEAGAGCELVALSASCTDRVLFNNVQIDHSMLLGGPIEEVLSTGKGATAGGLQTSTLAIGLSRAAIDFLIDEASRREDLRAATNELDREWKELAKTLLLAIGGDERCDAAEVRGKANGLAMRSTQAALTAAKGAGFVEGHPVGRWCRQAMFFLVWSCPQPVAQAHLCELAGIQ